MSLQRYSAPTLMLNHVENEVVILKAILELIDSIVNFEILELGDSDPTEIRFKSITHAEFFNIVLVDILSMTDKSGLVNSEPYLVALRKITQTPNFNVSGSVDLLSDSTLQFMDWLKTSITIDKVWLPTAQVQTDLQITRIELVKIAGNICRHNLLRAVGIAQDVRKILERGGISISLDQALLLLGDLNEWLHTHVFLFHSSTIAEFLNNIRWDIYCYLQPEISGSITWEAGNPPIYQFTYPKGIDSDFAKNCYWDLMNRVRSPPYMRRFQVTELLKNQF